MTLLVRAGQDEMLAALDLGLEAAGARIALELWSLPLETVGSFLAGIPAPLGLGTLALSDGGTVQGFLSEAAAAVEGAVDITDPGDWRRHLATL
ncbi:allophanate hydrolase-related protein [Phaeovulum sp. W22_SRMD_FR3]|uniref:allophanate hydrolase-related protein n=1 Tax=Phaeovulum sp. W22_SRMD_FR3 TaxID=3240274 RepID=UPI003F9C2165